MGYRISCMYVYGYCIVCRTTLERNVTLHYHPRVQRLLFVDSKCFRYGLLGCIKQKRGRIKWSSDDIVPNKLRMDGGCTRTMLKVFEWVDCYETRLSKWDRQNGVVGWF